MKDFKLEDSTKTIKRFRAAFNMVMKETVYEYLGYDGPVQQLECEHDEVLSLEVYQSGFDYDNPSNILFYFSIMTGSIVDPFYVKIFPGSKAGDSICMKELSLQDGLAYLMGKILELHPIPPPPVHQVIDLSSHEPF